MGYVAKLTGVSKKFGFERDFVKNGDFAYSGRGKYARVDNPETLIGEDGVYEIKYGGRGQYRDYYKMENGAVEKIDAEQAKALIQE